MGTYNCRTIANSKIMSEHSYGTAIDIFQIDDANVKNDWNKVKKKESCQTHIKLPVNIFIMLLPQIMIKHIMIIFILIMVWSKVFLNNISKNYTY